MADLFISAALLFRSDRVNVLLLIVAKRFERMRERDGRTDGQTPHGGIGRSYA